jgi:hypothetical protein
MNRLAAKHPRAIRWMHWLNVPVLVEAKDIQPA